MYALKNCLRDSFKFERGHPTELQLDALVDMAQVVRSNDLTWSEYVRLYHTFMPAINPVLRTCPVYIGCDEGKDHNLLNKDELLELIRRRRSVHDLDSFQHNYKLYLEFERIHPHFDGNGRMGRYIFLEWHGWCGIIVYVQCLDCLGVVCCNR